jgi:hypothetical protein
MTGRTLNELYKPYLMVGVTLESLISCLKAGTGDGP